MRSKQARRIEVFSTTKETAFQAKSADSKICRGQAIRGSRERNYDDGEGLTCYGQRRGRVGFPSRVIQDLGERGEERLHVGFARGFAHQTDPPDFAFQRTETGADFNVEVR